MMEMPNPVRVFRATKRIYTYRSRIAHGSTPGTKEQSVSVWDQGDMPTIAAAVKFLRMALAALIEHPQYLNPDKID